MSDIPSKTPVGAARHLRVRLIDDGVQKVDLTLPSAAAGHLPDLLPEDLGVKLQDRGIDVGAIAANAASLGFPPGDLFTMTDGSKQVHVWLE